MTSATSSTQFQAVRPDIADAVKTASARSGVNFSYLMAQAAVESGFKPDAKSGTSSAQGLFQFLKGTWMNVVKEHGPKHGLGQYAQAIEKGQVDPMLEKQILALRNDPKVASLLAAEYARDNKTHLEQSVGKVANVDLYLAHFLGPNGAEKFLQAQRANPGRSAADLFPDAAKSNRSIFYDGDRARSLGEVRNLFAAKLDGAGKAEVRHAYVSESVRPRNAVPDVKWIPETAPVTPRFAAAAELILLSLAEVDGRLPV